MRILIFEDEIPAAERLQNLLASVDGNHHILGVYDSVEEAIRVLADGIDADLIISDVELADGLCFGIFKEVKTDIPIIFTTAYNQYAIRAFETNAIDYLLKPVKIQYLKRALEKAAQRIGSNVPEIDYNILAQAMLRQQKGHSKRYISRYGTKMKVIKPSEACYFYSMQKSTFVVDDTGKALPLDESLNLVENDLDVDSFFRINRNLIVNIKSIQSVDMLGKGRLKIIVDNPPEDEQFLVVSADRSPEFRTWLQGGREK